MDQIFNDVVNFIHSVIGWFANLVPGTPFGLLLIPIIVLAVISLAVSRR